MQSERAMGGHSTMPAGLIMGGTVHARTMGTLPTNSQLNHLPSSLNGSPIECLSDFLHR